tara:strand:- start:18815 stop:19372 length:558 start_codon:yes stop_codon:yes gene_type:complete
VLAGGAGSRMGGKDKGLVPYLGKPLISYSINTLKLHTNKILINANRNLELYRTFGFQVITDLSKDRLGPLGGIKAGLCHCRTDILMVVSCDTPDLPNDLIKNLYFALIEGNFDFAMPYTTDSLNEKRTHPSTMMIRTGLGQSLDNYLSTGQRKIDRWTETLNGVEVRFENHSEFKNVNYTDDLKK